MNIVPKWLTKLLGGDTSPVQPPVVYDSVWEAVRGFVHDPRWEVELLAERDDWFKIKFDKVVGELIRDPEEEWFHVRFRVPFTEEQKNAELALYEWWSNYSARQTVFRWDIDLINQEYTADGFALFADQFDQVECIRALFNSAKLLTEETNQIVVGRHHDYEINGKRNNPSVALALWEWFEGPLAPVGTKIEHSGYREHSYWMGSAVGAVSQEQWFYYALIRFGAGDYMKYMQQDDERRLMLYKMHLDIQRRYPRIRNFVALTPNPVNNGSQETSLPIVVSSGSSPAPIFERCFKDLYNVLIDYTEWFNYDFTPETAPWFDHSVKKPQSGYIRTPASESPRMDLPKAPKN
ncbi:hypothetical protein EHF33_08995 [Deinococcus psychrotolerans]|uniref:Uncharacterized protein n=1 Tax=Deinococcus psychrotolerans TaxID=2489213 RepID=A0A3G8YBW7_9DEIO|nr:hypothetical protein [Deinococcus psychrotolerans]AZI42869.1 hypothetical protein EHF33_08995 [Deinococcus psychrotolerans]